MKKLLSLLLLVMWFALLLSCGSGKEAGAGSENVLKVNNQSDPFSLHPAFSEGTHQSWILNHVFEGLAAWSQEGTIVPGQAESWDLASDNVTYTFYLRDNLKWSNGDPLTAKDFEESWKFAMNPVNAAYYAYQFYYIDGVEEFHAGSGSLDDVGVKALDDTTLQVVLKTPAPYFIELTAFYTYFPIHPENNRENPDWYLSADNYISNGPFRMTEWRPKELVTVEKNEHYYKKDQIKLDGIEFSMIENQNTFWQKFIGGDFEVITDPPLEVIAQKHPDVVLAPDLALYYYNLNMEKPPFNNKKVRQALSYAIDRELLVERVTQGGQTPAYGFIPNGVFAEDGSTPYRETQSATFTKDFEKAKRLFEEGLAEEGFSIDNFSFTLLYNTSENHRKIAEAVQQMWRENLDFSAVSLENTEFQVKLKREKAGEYDVSRAGWIGDFVDPMTFLELWETDGSYNDPKYSDAMYDNLLSVAKSTANQKVRFDAMRQAEAMLMEDMPVAPLYYYTQPYARKEYVKGIVKPINRYPLLIYVELDK